MADSGHVFTDPEGDILESWQVPLEHYLAAYGYEDAKEDPRWDRKWVHLTRVALALAEGKPVDPKIVAEHDQAELTEWVAFYRSELAGRREREKRTEGGVEAA